MSKQQPNQDYYKIGGRDQTEGPDRVQPKEDAKQQFALFVLECAATHGHADDQRGHAQQRQPAQAQMSEQGRGHRLVHRHGHEARVLTDARVEWGKMRRSLGRLLVGAGLLRA